MNDEEGVLKRLASYTQTYDLVGNAFLTNATAYRANAQNHGGKNVYSGAVADARAFYLF